MLYSHGAVMKMLWQDGCVCVGGWLGLGLG